MQSFSLNRKFTFNLGAGLLNGNYQISGEVQGRFCKIKYRMAGRFYTVEPFDQDMMDRVDELIQNGAMVYLALENESVLAVCMTMPLSGDIWEMCKLAAAGQYTGTGAGSRVFKACMDYAIANGAKKLSLISCRALKPAIHIYEKFGFREVPLNKEFWGAEKADIEMEYIVHEQ